MVKKSKYIPPIIVSPEAYGLPGEMDPMAPYVSRKGGGGLGDVTKGIIDGLYKKNIPAHYIGPNYKKIFRESSGLSNNEYMNRIHKTARPRTHLVSTRHFAGLNNIYDGSAPESAASLQELAIPIIKDIRSNNKGKAIVHTQDQFAGIIPAYCKAKGIPVIHTMHNGFTFLIKHSRYHYAEITDEPGGYKNLLYDTSLNSKVIDSHATAVKNADIVTLVGQEFTNEIINGRYDNWDIFANARNTFNELKIKAEHDQVRVVMNGISPEEFPENHTYLKYPFGPETSDIVGTKNNNKPYFQRRMGLKVNKNAHIFFAPSRIEDTQKGISIIIGSALEFLYANPDAQIAIVGDANKDNKKYEEQIRQAIRDAPPGSIGLAAFNKDLSNLGYDVASAVVGASRYEPFGLFWLQGICAGAYGIGARNGGAVDIIRDINEHPNIGNGFLYNNIDVGGLSYGLNTTMKHLREISQNPQAHNDELRRMMIKGRTDFSLDKMIDGYIELYEELGVKFDLFNEGYGHFIRK